MALSGGLAALVLAHPALAQRAAIHTAVVGLCAVLWGVLLVSAPGQRGEWVPEAWLAMAAAAMTGGAVLSLGLSPERHWPGLAALAGQLLLVWVGWWLVRGTASQLRSLVGVAVVGAAAAGVYGLLQYWHEDPLAPATGFSDRVVSTLENPNYFGSFEGMVLPLALAGFCRAGGHRDRALWLGLVAAIYTGLLLSGTRGAWVGAVVGCAVLLAGLVIQVRRRAVRIRPGWTAGLVAALATITALLADEPVLERAAGPVTVEERMRESANIVGERARTDYTVNHRYMIWQVTWQLIRERPVLGQGPGAFADSFVRMRQALQARGLFPVEGWNSYFDTAFAHNEYLHLWSESGLLTLVGFAGLVAGALLVAVREGWRRRGEALILWGGLGLVVVVLVHGLVSYPMQLPLSGTLFWLALGGLAALGGPDRPG